VVPELKIFSRISFAIFLLLSIILGGSLGYMMIEGYSPIEAFYMTVITISTVGFTEVRPLSDTGRIFTAFLILTSIGTFTYTISVITSYFVSGEYRSRMKEAKVNKEIQNFRDHVIICGFGRVGSMAARQLDAINEKIVVIETSKDKADMINDTTNYWSIHGNAARDENLLNAGIERARALIATMPDDADNLYVVLTAHELNPNLTIISRASHSESVKKLRIAGANNVIMPDKVGGAHMASLVVTPDVVDFLDHIRIQGGTDINLEEVSFKALPEDFHFKTLGDLDVRNRFGVNVIGYKTSEGEYIINPGADTKIVPDSKLFVLGNRSQINDLNKALGLSIKT
jgi:voltage-gated potassium channel